MKAAMLLSIGLFSATSLAFEVDNFYNRNKPIKDSSDQINFEINAKIQKAVLETNTCNLEELYTNVRNQINADSAGMGVIGGMEGWATKSNKIERIDPPPGDESIYSGSSFESSVFSMGFWLKVYKSAMDGVKNGSTKIKFNIEKMLGGSQDPVSFCNVPKEQQEMAQMMLSGGPPGGPGGGPMGPPPNGMHGPPGMPPMSDEMKKHFEGQREKMMKFKDSEPMKCLEAFSKKMKDGISGNLEPIINIGGHKVGVDKLGHFFDQGADYFKEAYKIDGSHATLLPGGLSKALALGKSQEEGMFGLLGTGIKSYGDVSANYGGFLFWQQLANGQNPIARCVSGKFQVGRRFDIRDYVTDAWDEGINCSEYKDAEMSSIVENNLKKKKMSCPAEAEKCTALASQYDALVLKEILSPKCATLIKDRPARPSNQKTNSSEERGVR